LTRGPRFRPGDLGPDDLGTARRALYDAITGGPRGTGPRPFPLTDDEGVLRGPFDAFLLSPELGDALQRLGATVRYRTALDDRVREIAILMVAARRDSAFERAAHEPIGRAAGVTEDEIREIREHGAPRLDDPREAACVTVTRALLDGDVDDETWAACVPPLDRSTVFELSTLVGYYSTLALQLRVFRV
jgi:4-carboxymuconolactone decarboxylase